MISTRFKATIASLVLGALLAASSSAAAAGETAGESYPTSSLDRLILASTQSSRLMTESPLGLESTESDDDLNRYPTPYIYGGVPVRPGDWKELVILADRVGHGYEFFCAGTLIREDLVLTAAHCVERNNYHIDPTDLVAIIGQTSLIGSSGEQIAVRSVSLAPQRNAARSDQHDIALIHLDNISTKGRSMVFARPDLQPDFDLYPAAVLAGWGETEYSDRSEILLEVAVGVQPSAVCASIYPEYYSNSELCLGNQYFGACRGDSGGAVYGLEHNSQQLLLAAVVSRGYVEPCADLPFIATAIAPYAVWINSAGTSPRAQRIAGTNRYSTSVSLALDTARATGNVDGPTIYVASGENFPDALSASAAAGSSKGVILLTEHRYISGDVAVALHTLNPSSIVVVGGESVISPLVIEQIKATTGLTPTRIFGHDRYATAAAISAATFEPGVEFAFVAVGTNYPDALAAAPIAGAVEAPMLLVEQDTIPLSVRSELTRLAPKEIVILGGHSAISARVSNELGTIAPTSRISGHNREATAIALADLYEPGVDAVYLATGNNFPDALAAGPLAAVGPGPILLLGQEQLSNEVFEEILRLRPARIVALGGEKVVDPSVLFRLSMILEHRS